MKVTWRYERSWVVYIIYIHNTLPLLKILGFFFCLKFNH